MLAEIAAALQVLSISNCNERELRRYRQFYVTYPSMEHSLLADNQIRGMLSPESVEKLESIEKQAIRGAASPGLEVPDNHIETLLFRLSYSHFVELIRIEDPLMRLFYEVENLKGNWSVKELKRQVGSLLFERTGLSKNKEQLLKAAAQSSNAHEVRDIIRDPYIFEFLGLRSEEVVTERKLEDTIIDHLKDFLLELGKGFCFEARQKRVLIDQENYFIDLVFYHRMLHCNVLLEIKTERFHHSHAGQLNMYLEYYKKYEMVKGDNPPVGILLCTGKDQEHVEFATAGMDDKLFISQYMMALPDKKDLEQFIKKELRH